MRVHLDWIEHFYVLEHLHRQLLLGQQAFERLGEERVQQIQHLIQLVRPSSDLGPTRLGQRELVLAGDRDLPLDSGEGGVNGHPAHLFLRLDGRLDGNRELIKVNLARAVGIPQLKEGVHVSFLHVPEAVDAQHRQGLTELIQ